MKAFECKTCGDCCYGEGGILLNAGEPGRIAAFIGVPEGDFVARFCRNRQGRLYINTGTNLFCIFYHSDQKCLIHPVKPERCAKWPFFPALLKDRDAWEMAKGACPGINPESTFEEFLEESHGASPSPAEGKPSNAKGDLSPQGA